MPPDDDPARPDSPTEECPRTTKTDPMPRTIHQNRNAELNFKGEKRSNATHASTTDPDVQLYNLPPEPGRCCASWGM